MNRSIRLDNQPLFGSQDQSWSPDSGDDGNRAHGRVKIKIVLKRTETTTTKKQKKKRKRTSAIKQT